MATQPALCLKHFSSPRPSSLGRGERIALWVLVVLLMSMLVASASTAVAQGTADVIPLNRLRLYEPNRVLGNMRLTGNMNKAIAVLSDPEADAVLLKQAIGELQSIISGTEDAFVSLTPPDPTVRFGTGDDLPPLRAAKQVAEEVLSQLPDKGREVYELTHGGEATDLLKRGREGDIAALRELSHLYLNTDAGIEGSYLLASAALDAGRRSEAYALLRRLLKSAPARRRHDPALTLKYAFVCQHLGEADEAQKIVATLSPQDLVRLPAELKTQDGKVALEKLSTLGGKATAIDEAVTSWTHFLGSASRASRATAGLPSEQRLWDRSTLGVREEATPEGLKSFRYVQNADPDVEWAPPTPWTEAELAAAIQVGHEWLVSRERQSRGVTLPASHPLVLNGLAIVRTLSRVTAINLKTGAVKWEASAVDPAFADLFAVGNRWDYLRARVNDEFFVSPLQKFQQGYLESRTRVDRTVGTLSSDGRLVFFLDACGVPDPRNVQPTYGTKAMVPQTWNRLCAVSLATGRTEWEVGAPSQHQDDSPVGEFFLGAPTFANGLLYALNETTQALRLICLDPATGKELWAEQICIPYDSVDGAALRRVAACSPTYVDGLLICPTASGFLCAYDPVARRLRWSYGYRTLISSQEERGFPVGRGQVTQLSFDGLADTNRWQESSIHASQTSLVAAQVDSNTLHCVNAITGELRWRVPRGDGLYVACIAGDQIIVVGERDVRSIRLSDGTDAWKVPLGERVPSGRALRVGMALHVPVGIRESRSNPDDAEPTEEHVAGLMTIDVRDGRLIAMTRGPRDWLFGNLAAGDGYLVSQSCDRVTAFPAVQDIEEKIATQLAANGKDAAALAQRGRLRLFEQREAEGLADLVTSLKAQPNQQVRELLVDVAMERMRRGHSSPDEITQLLSDIELPLDSQRRLIELEAEILTSKGQPLVALRRLMRLVENSPADDRIATQRGAVKYYKSQILSSLLATTYRQAVAAGLPELKAFDDEVQARLNAAMKQPGADVLNKFVRAYGWHPVAREARWELATSDRLDLKEHFLERERHLLSLREQPDLADAADVALLGLWIESGRSAVAVGMFDEIERRAGSRRLNDGTLVREKLAQLKNLDSVKQAAKPEPWGAEAKVSAAPRTEPTSYPEIIPVLGPISPAVRGWTFERVLYPPAGMSVSPRMEIRALDANGQARWTLPLEEEELGTRNWVGMNLITHGHLAALSGNGFVVMLDLSKEDRPAVLWVRNVLDFAAAYGPALAAEMSSSSAIDVARKSRWQVQLRMLHLRQFYTGSADVLTSDRLLYRTDSQLIAVDALTGQPLWSRSDIPTEARLISDEQHVVALRDGKPSQVLRLADGELVGVPLQPLYHDHLTSRGCELVLWHTGLRQTELIKSDARTNKLLWKREYPGRAAVQIVDHELIFVLDPNGWLECLDAASTSAEPIFRQRLASSITAKYMHVLPSRDGYVVLTDSKTTIDRPEWTQWPQPSRDQSTVQGTIFGLAKDGSLKWSAETRHQEVVLGQPREVPVVLLSVPIMSIADAGNSRAPRRTVQILDRRSGDILFNEAAIPVGDFNGVHVLPEKKRIDLKYSLQTIAIQF